MSASLLVGERPEAPALPPARRPTWPRWRPALRLAIRDARASRGRSALIVALVALPVALVVGLYLFGTSRAWADLQGPSVALDSFAPGSVELDAKAPDPGAASGAIGDSDIPSLMLTDELVVGLAVAFLQIVMLAGSAFAVSLRRRQRELALLSAAGAEPGDLTRAVLASGILLGGIGALLGFVLPWSVLVAGRPVIEWASGWPLASVPPMELAIVLVPIVGLAAAVAASVVPARMAARIPLAQALRALDSANIGLHAVGRGPGRVPVRSALAGVALIVMGVVFLMIHSAGADEGTGVGGWPIWALGLAVVVCELGVVLLAPLVLAFVSSHSRALPLTARLAVRDAARNRLRSSFAVAAVAVAVGLLAGCLTWLSSLQSAVQAAYQPAAAPGAAVVARYLNGLWGDVGSGDRAAVASEFPDARVALIGLGPTWNPGAGDSLAVRSQCDPLTAFGLSSSALGIMAPADRASLAAALAPDDPCRAPVPAGGPEMPMTVIGDPSWLRPGVVVADADTAALLIGREDPVVRAQLESGGAVAMAPSAVVDGKVRIAADPRRVDGAQAGPTQLEPGPQAEIAAVVVDSPYRPAAVIVAPRALSARGLPVPRNAILVVPPEPDQVAAPQMGQLVGPDGLQVVSVESGPRHLSMGSTPWGDSLSTGSLPVGWGLVVVPLAFALLATILVTALALGDVRPELATMAAVGASPGVRRRFAMWAAVIIAVVGSVLGALAGIAPAWAALRSVRLIPDPASCLWSPVGSDSPGRPEPELGMVYCDVPLAIPLDVPWLWLASVVVGLPVLAGLFFLVVTRSRVVIARR